MTKHEHPDFRKNREELQRMIQLETADFVDVTVTLGPTQWRLDLQAIIGEVLGIEPCGDLSLPTLGDIKVTQPETHIVRVEIGGALRLSDTEVGAVRTALLQVLSVPIDLEIVLHNLPIDEGPCPDCNGTGVYVGLHEVTPCSTCT